MIYLIIINSISILMLAIALLLHITNKTHKKETYSLKDLELNNKIQRWYQEQRNERNKK